MMEAQHLAGSSDLARSKNDFYPTPECATLALLSAEDFSKGPIWEPACGDGAISKVLEARGLPVTSTDLNDFGYGKSGVNFLAERDRWFSYVITNPPYSLAQEFIAHALTCSHSKVAMLLKLNFLEGQKRSAWLKTTPLAMVYVFSKRLSFNRADENGGGSGVLAYAWFVWKIGYAGRPMIGWI